MVYMKKQKAKDQPKQYDGGGVPPYPLPDLPNILTEQPKGEMTPEHARMAAQIVKDALAYVPADPPPKPEPTLDSCSNCRYLTPTLCRRFPKYVYRESGQWCGEHKPKA
jgi:hypothetical protein